MDIQVDLEDLESSLALGLERSPRSSSKWAEVVAWITETFGVSEEEVRVSMLASPANKQNRLYEAFYHNPQILVFVCKGGTDDKGQENMTPAMAQELIQEMMVHLRERWAVTPNLRTLIITEGNKVMKVIKYRLEDSASVAE